MRRLTALLLLSCLAALPAMATSHVTKVTDVRVTMSDGVVLTSDVYIPTVGDADGDGLYPCVVELTPYRKESRAAEGVSYLPSRGIAVIEVDARGTGGSGGEYDIVFSVREQADAAEWVEWAATTATKPNGDKLCEDEVGMYGGSYSGIIQYLVASLPATAQGNLPAAPRHLAAIAPQRAYGDLYRDIVYHGGQLIGSFGTIWSTGTTGFYTQPPMDLATAAGRDAWRDHLTKNDPMMRHYIDAPYIDATYTSDDAEVPYTQSLYDDSSVLPRIENLRVPTLHLAGFFDAFTRGQLLTFSKAHELERTVGGRGPNFLIAGPWNHSGTHFITPDQGYKNHLGDWYAYWLEGREAGSAPATWITDGFDGAGARVRYFQSVTGTVNGQSSTDGAWRNAPTWPPAARVQHLRLTGDHALQPVTTPTYGPSWTHNFLSNPTAGTAEAVSRWDNAASGSVPHPQHDQRLENGKGSTYTSAPLASDLTVAGPIAASLTLNFVETGGARSGGPGPAGLAPGFPDIDLVVKLSDVAPDGSARLVTQGFLRASHRAVDPARSVYLDGELMMPFHPHTSASILTDGGDGASRDYEIEIWPTAKTFAAGHALRLDVYAADTPNHLTLPYPAIVSLRNGSYLRVPVTP